MSNLDEIIDEAKLNEIAKPCFVALDINKSGTIDENELAMAFNQLSQSVGQKPPSKSEIKQLMEIFDINKSGAIEYDEFKEIIRMLLNEIENK